MAAFYNQATLSYSGGTVYSNIASGEILEVITVAKTAVQDEYAQGGDVTYVINLVNSGASALTGLTLTDDLGAYTFGTMTLVPLAYVSGSVNYFVNGALQPAPQVTAGETLVISGISVPAGGNAAVVYTAHVTEYASPEQGGSVTNTVTVSGGGITEATASATVNASAAPSLEMLKSVSPAVVTDNGVLSYTFTVQNFGAAEAGADDSIVLNDTFDPILTGLTVTYNGAAWTVGDNYTYNAETGLFSTVAGGITVPAATYVQDETTGAWNVTPGEAVLVVSGTV